MSAGSAPSGSQADYPAQSAASESVGEVPSTNSRQTASSPASSGLEAGAFPYLGALLDAVTAATSADDSTSSESRSAIAWLDRLLQEPDPYQALKVWVNGLWPAGERPSPRQMRQRLARDLGQLDALLSDQVNAILHHPRLQQLEASWRGLWQLTEQAAQGADMVEGFDEPPEVVIRVLNASKRDLWRDLDGAVEFDQSQIFKKVYEAEFGTAGGTPFGVLIGDYQLTHHPEDLDLLRGMAGVAAAAFAPFITGAAPQLAGLDDYSSLERPINLSKTFEQVEYIKWNEFRNSDDARFVGLTLPRVLMRVPYETNSSRKDGFRFQEDVAGLTRDRYLWGNAAYSFSSVVMRAYQACRWFADIRGVERGVFGGGLVTGLPVHSFGTDRQGVATKYSTEVAVNDYQEKELSTLGFIPLCHCADTEYSVFYTNNSAQKPATFPEAEATTNARISAMLQYVFCASRFAHYLKVLARNKIGGMLGEQDLERALKKWIGEYITADPKADSQTKAKYPLREAQLEVREIPGRPGSFRLVMNLLPHFQLDGLTATLRLSMKMTPAAGG